MSSVITFQLCCVCCPVPGALSARLLRRRATSLTPITHSQLHAELHLNKYCSPFEPNMIILVDTIDSLKRLGRSATIRAPLSTGQGSTKARRLPVSPQPPDPTLFCIFSNTLAAIHNAAQDTLFSRGAPAGTSKLSTQSQHSTRSGAASSRRDQRSGRPIEPTVQV